MPRARERTKRLETLGGGGQGWGFGGPAAAAAPPQSPLGGEGPGTHHPPSRAARTNPTRAPTNNARRSVRRAPGGIADIVTPFARSLRAWFLRRMAFARRRGQHNNASARLAWPNRGAAGGGGRAAGRCCGNPAATAAECLLLRWLSAGLAGALCYLASYLSLYAYRWAKRLYILMHCLLRRRRLARCHE